MTEGGPVGTGLTPLQRLEVEDQLTAAERKLRLDPWRMLAAVLVASAVQYPIFGMSIAWAISCVVVAVVIGAVEIRDRRITTALVGELRSLLEPGGPD
jgi:hypothetical protein